MAKVDGSRRGLTPVRRGRQLAVLALALVAILGVGAVVVMRPGLFGTVTGTERPSGGIGEQRAIEIATGTSAASGHVSAAASPGYDTGLERWVWRVHWAFSAGPTSGEFCDILVDYQTGDILDRQCVYS